MVPNTTFCNFCKSVGNEYKDCRTLEIMKERTSDAYRVQDESMAGQLAQQYNQYYSTIHYVQTIKVKREDSEEEVVEEEDLEEVEDQWFSTTIKNLGTMQDIVHIHLRCICI